MSWFSKAVHTLLIASDFKQNNVCSIQSSSYLLNKTLKTDYDEVHHYYATNVYKMSLYATGLDDTDRGRDKQF